MDEGGDELGGEFGCAAIDVVGGAQFGDVEAGEAAGLTETVDVGEDVLGEEAERLRGTNARGVGCCEGVEAEGEIDGLLGLEDAIDSRSKVFIRIGYVNGVLFSCFKEGFVVAKTLHTKAGVIKFFLKNFGYL